MNRCAPARPLSRRARRVAKPAHGVVARTPGDVRLMHDGIDYEHVTAMFDRASGVVTITVSGPTQPPPATAGAARDLGSRYWPLAIGP